MTIAEKRKQNSIKKLKRRKIDYLETLPLVESSVLLTLKSLDEICDRALACFVTFQFACDIANGQEHELVKDFYVELLERYEVKDCLLPSEQKILDNKFDEKELINMTWSYETFWSLVWALGLLENKDIEKPYDLCDGKKATELVVYCKNKNEFKQKCKLRDIEEILDMVDLYYRYHWACVDVTLNPKTRIGKLNPEVVYERRKGLEWLISKEKNWEEISLDT